MAISAITPIDSACGAPTQSLGGFNERGRFSCGQERGGHVGRTGSFADGQSAGSTGASCIGRFSTGQETTAVAGRGREGSFADGNCRPPMPSRLRRLVRL